MKIRSGPFTMISLMSGVENQMLDWTEKGQNQLETVHHSCPSASWRPTLDWGISALGVAGHLQIA
jgi:hypothetical protein